MQKGQKMAKLNNQARESVEKVNLYTRFYNWIIDKAFVKSHQYIKETRR